MTVIAGKLIDVAGAPSTGSVTIRSAATRPSAAHPGAVVTRELFRADLQDGAFQTPELDPGTIIVDLEIDSSFERWTIDLPEDGRHELSELIGTKVIYEPSVVGRVEGAAQEANKSAAAAGKAATAAMQAEQRVMAIVVDSAEALREELQDTIETVETARNQAVEAKHTIEQAHTAAEQVRQEVLDARDAAAESADQAEVAATAAADSVRDELAGIRSEVTTDAQAAHADAAKASEAEQTSEQIKQAVTDAAARASGYATDAKNAADRAAEDRRQVATDRDATATSAAEARQAAASAKVGAPETGWDRSTLASGVRDSLARADSALQSIPQATSSAPGAIKLAGDLAGTADAPRVQGAVREADAVEAVTGGKVVRRTSAGALLVPDVSIDTPPQAAVPRAYVDSLVTKGWRPASCEIADNGAITDPRGTRKFQFTRLANGDIRLVGEFGFGEGVLSTAGGDIRVQNLPGAPFAPGGIRLLGSGELNLGGMGRCMVTPYVFATDVRFLVPANFSTAFAAPMRLWDGSQVDSSYPSGVNILQQYKSNIVRFDITYPSAT